jgi:hypothetical protein
MPSASPGRLIARPALVGGLALMAGVGACLLLGGCGHATRSDADRVSYPTMTDGPEGPIGRPDRQHYLRADPL